MGKINWQKEVKNFIYKHQEQKTTEHAIAIEEGFANWIEQQFDGEGNEIKPIICFADNRIEMITGETKRYYPVSPQHLAKSLFSLESFLKDYILIKCGYDIDKIEDFINEVSKQNNIDKYLEDNLRSEVEGLLETFGKRGYDG